MLASSKSTENLSDVLIDHAVRSIEAGEFSASPYPHIVFRDVFPAAFYRDLVRSVPNQGYEPITGTGSRMALRLYGSHLARIEPELQPLWKAVQDMLTSPELEGAIRRRLDSGLKIRARGDKVANPADLTLFAKPVIYRDSDGYEIKPHPDTRKKVVTMQLYCPEDDSQAALGTTIYQASLKGLLHPRSYCLEPVKTIPFIPNIGYAFVVLKAYHSLTQMSWHGRPKITTDKARISILNTFYASEQAGF
ncbi:MAG TPA: hypothetical protein VKY22_15770 [Bradyrhizobium sp.]|jgi:hypothetical protein|nr:hypothetical protein [Bradyrhizobium sp.]